MNYEPVRTDDAEAFADFILGEAWPFHSPATLDREAIIQRVRDGAYWNRSTRAFWIVPDDAAPVGLVQLRDLGDPSPTFDLRLRAAHRGHGIGAEAVRWLTGHIFSEHPDKVRIEGTTRHDNIAMRRAFERCGWVQEACYRMAWTGSDGAPVDAVAYAILRTDWANGTTTPVHFRSGGVRENTSDGAPKAEAVAVTEHSSNGAAERVAAALLDVERLALAGILAAREMPWGPVTGEVATIEQIAAELRMKPALAARRLRHLREAGIIAAVEAEGRTAYALDRSAMNALATAVAERTGAGHEHAAEDALRGFVEGERLIGLPAKHAKRVVVLAWLAGKFAPDTDYPEREVNAVITQYHPDYASMRRALVDYGFMTRARGVYRRTPAAEPTTEPARGGEGG